jgi:hypothetical protein
VNQTPDLSQFPTGTFDFVYSRLVLQHIPPPSNRTYVGELVRVLATRGVGMFQLPQPDAASKTLFVHAPITGSPLKRLIPRPLVILWRLLKYPLVVSTAEPWREIYGITREEVEAIVHREGGRLLAAYPDRAHGGGGSGFEYWVMKG